jgi:SAM-dependent methyltransferase
MKLDIACGQNKKEGFTGIDSIKVAGVDIVHDLDKFPWPFEDNSVEEINCSHYLEHTGDLCRFMDECYRILIPGGKMQVVSPYYTSVRCWQDPTHKRAISEMTFMYFNAGWRLSQKLDHYPIRCDFDFTYGYSINAPWNQKAEEARNFAITHYVNVVSDIFVTLTKRTPT